MHTDLILTLAVVALFGDVAWGGFLVVTLALLAGGQTNWKKEKP